MPWPRRSNATSRKSCRSGLSYCLAQPEVILGPGVDEQDRRPVRVAPLADVQPHVAAPLHRVRLRSFCQPLTSSTSWVVVVGGSSPPHGVRASGERTYLRLARAVSSAGGILTGVSTTFVGRVRELEALERALEAARAGSGATVLVEGEAGIGKSRLVSEFARRARDAGVEVLVGRSIDLIGTELPFQPFMEALRPVGELRGAHAAGRVRGDARAAARPRGGGARHPGPRGRALGRYVDRSTWSCFSRTTLLSSGSCW